jgi:hypothetical protein
MFKDRPELSRDVTAREFVPTFDDQEHLTSSRYSYPDSPPGIFIRTDFAGHHPVNSGIEVQDGGIRYLYVVEKGLRVMEIVPDGEVGTKGKTSRPTPEQAEWFIALCEEKLEVSPDDEFNNFLESAKKQLRAAGLLS